MKRGRRRMVRRMRRERRRMIVGGMLLIGAAGSAVKMSQADAQKIEQETGMAPDEIEPEDLDATMKDLGIQPQPVTVEDQQAIAADEAAHPDAGKFVQREQENIKPPPFDIQGRWWLLFLGRLTPGW
jgi:hypothetical protein